LIFLLASLLVIVSSPARAALVDNHDGTVTDTETGLMWQQASTSGYYFWQEALLYAEFLSLAGYDDWRLPNRNELQSIVDYAHYNPTINTSVFPGTASSYYWSSTTYANGYINAWVVSFNYGNLDDSDKWEQHHVRAVRGEQGGSFDNSIILPILMLLLD
jgi:hypothetical protein